MAERYNKGWLRWGLALGAFAWVMSFINFLVTLLPSFNDSNFYNSLMVGLVVEIVLLPICLAIGCLINWFYP